MNVILKLWLIKLRKNFTPPFPFFSIWPWPLSLKNILTSPANPAMSGVTCCSTCQVQFLVPCHHLLFLLCLGCCHQPPDDMLLHMSGVSEIAKCMCMCRRLHQSLLGWVRWASQEGVSLVENVRNVGTDPAEKVFRILFFSFLIM